MFSKFLWLLTFWVSNLSILHFFDELNNASNCFLKLYSVAYYISMGAISWGTRGTCPPLFQVGGYNMPIPPTFSLQVLYLEKLKKQ